MPPDTTPTLRRRSLALSLAAAALPTRATQPELLVLRTPGPRDVNDRRDEFSHELLTEALAAAGHPVQLERVRGLGQRRILSDMASGQIDVAALPTVGALPPELIPVRWPIRRGLLGLRLLLAQPQRAAALAAVRSVEELQRFTLGYGVDWQDVDRMRDLGFKLETSGNYTGLFQMLRAGRFDYLHRGVNEIWDELGNPNLAGTGMVVVPDIALYYPLDEYFCVSPQAQAWAPRIERGLQALRASGRYTELFRARYGQALRRANLPQRRVIHLLGYGIEPNTPIDEFDVLRLHAAPTELRLPR